MIKHDSIWIAVMAILIVMLAIFSNPADAYTDDDLLELIEAVKTIEEEDYDYWILPDDYEEEYFLELESQQIEV